MYFQKTKYDFFLHPDNAYLTQRKSGIITTVLGSCIAITMFCKSKHIAAMCHASLPQCPDLQLNLNRNSPLVFKYVDSSIYKMIDWFKNKNFNMETFEVKIFGGANYFIKSDGNKGVFNVGENNIDMTKQTLEHFNLKIKAKDIGGSDGRKIIFNVADGSVFLKRIPH